MHLLQPMISVYIQLHTDSWCSDSAVVWTSAELFKSQQMQEICFFSKSTRWP